MFNFLRGMRMPMGGQQAGGQQGPGFMARLQQGLRNPQTQQAMGAVGAQMLGMDPRLGMGAAQGLQQRRLAQGLRQAVPPLQRMQMDPRELLRAGSLVPMPMPQHVPMPMPGESLGGGGWQDPRLRALFGRDRNPTY